MDRRVGKRFWVGLLALAILMAGLLTAAPASAESTWDPNDVRGPLDLRWLGASFIPHDRFKLTVSFHDDFHLGALTHRRTLSRGVTVQLTDYQLGFFRVREDGRVVFIYGDFASSCCDSARVVRPSRTVLRVIFPTIHDPADLTYLVRARSSWRHGHVRDHTRWLGLGRPPGD
jgi:hypothetical protein